MTVFKIKLQEGFLACCSISTGLNLFSPKTSSQSEALAQMKLVGIALVTLIKPGFLLAVLILSDYSENTTQLYKKGKIILKLHHNLII